ncbi:MAG: hypothetical protein U0234_05220 [Sandaracinus sp.]
MTRITRLILVSSVLALGCRTRPHLVGQVRTAAGIERRALGHPYWEVLQRAEVDLPCAQDAIIMERIQGTGAFTAEGCGREAQYNCGGSCRLVYVRDAGATVTTPGL